ncbi:MAG TPA: hypothetical protein VND44_10310 [Acidimicrobiales bacterium]|nr:hypothetical protein [Acidimicrobiales bacterium]
MASTTKKIVITALATGGIVAGVATASAAPLRSVSPAAATSAEAQALHQQVASLTGREQALRARLQATVQARHHDTPAAAMAPESGARTSVAVGPTTAPAPPTTTTAPVPTTMPSFAAGDRSRDTGAEAPTSVSESEHPTTTSTSADPETATPSTGGGATQGDGEGGAHD